MKDDKKHMLHAIRLSGDCPLHSRLWAKLLNDHGFIIEDSDDETFDSEDFSFSESGEDNAAFLAATKYLHCTEKTIQRWFRDIQDIRYSEDVADTLRLIHFNLESKKNLKKFTDEFNKKDSKWKETLMSKLESRNLDKTVTVLRILEHYCPKTTFNEKEVGQLKECYNYWSKERKADDRQIGSITHSRNVQGLVAKLLTREGNKITNDDLKTMTNASGKYQDPVRKRWKEEEDAKKYDRS
eukprot:UN34653